MRKPDRLSGSASAGPRDRVRYRVRMVEFEGEEEFPQGYGMTWDSVVIDIPDDERIVHVEAFSSARNAGFNCLRPVTRVWLMSPVLTSSEASVTLPSE